MPNCQDVHDFCTEVTWDNLAWELVGLPTAVNMFICLAMVPINKYWMRNARTPFIRMIRRIVGD